MSGDAVRLREAAETSETSAMGEPNHRLRLLIVTAHGAAGSIPEAWRSYARIDDARASALDALRDPQVARVAIIEDGSGLGGSVNPLRFVGWVDR